MAKLWSPGTIASIRRALAGEPYIRRGEIAEWNWNFGVVSLATTKTGRARCAACGAMIPKGTLAALVTHTEANAGAGWSPVKRWIHHPVCS